jgi:hypothetical protein
MLHLQLLNLPLHANHRPIITTVCLETHGNDHMLNFFVPPQTTKILSNSMFVVLELGCPMSLMQSSNYLM